MTELLIDDYSAWLTARKYKAGTIYNYLRPIKTAAEKGLSLEELEAMDAGDFYCLITGPQNSIRALSESTVSECYHVPRVSAENWER